MSLKDIQQIYGARISDFELFLYFYEFDPEWRNLFEIQVGTPISLVRLQDMLGSQLHLYLSGELDSLIFDHIIEVMNGLKNRKLHNTELTCYRFDDEQDGELDFVVGKCLQTITLSSITQVPSEVILEVAMIPYWISKTILLLNENELLKGAEQGVFLLQNWD